MNLFTGHPTELKKALIEHIAAIKTDPLDKVLLILPSAVLAARIKKDLTAGKGIISALYTTNFFELAKNIYNDSSEDAKPVFADENLQNFILKNLQEKSGGNTTTAYVAALKSTLRDIVNAQLSPQALLDYTLDNSIQLSHEQREHIKRLSKIYGEYLNAISSPQHITYGELLNYAAEYAADSEYLKGFKHIIFYGFYDLTGLQIELLSNIRQNHEISFFMPYEPLASYHFAKNFYELHLLPYAKKHIKLSMPEGELPRFSAGLFDAQAKAEKIENIRIINTAGAFDEVEAAAKEILFLAEEKGIPFSQIALTARTLDNYKNDIFDVFEQNKIPINTALSFNFQDSSFGAFVLNLISLDKNNFGRDDVLAVVTSPYFNIKKETWPDIVASVGLSGGFTQWQDLLPYAKPEEDGTENKDAVKLLEIITDIKKNLDILNLPDTFDSLAAKAKDFINKYILPDSVREEDKIVLREVYKALESVAKFSTVRQRAKRAEFLEEVINILKGSGLNRVSSAHGGVMLADTMTLRAQSFKAIIIIGLNEGVFPSSPQEDPILKDNYRHDLQKLGHWILQKADRYSEERLLFYFALSSAQEQACLIYQRSDYSAKPKIPSVYITNEVLRLLGQSINDNEIMVQSRRPFEKYAQWPFRFLNKKEAALTSAVYATDVNTVLTAVINPEDKELLSTKITRAKELNAVPSLTDYDGQIGKNNKIAVKVKAEGISPSRLRNVYSCPAQFMFDYITGSDKNETLERASLAPKTIGNIYHKILENFYKYIKIHNLLHKIFNSGAQDILKTAAAPVLALENYKQYGMYPVVWEKLCKEIIESLTAFVDRDIKELAQSGFEPAYFEEKIKTAIKIKDKDLILRGTMDRVDISADGKNYQIIDYKKSVSTADTKKAIFKDGTLQPPLYFEMAKTCSLLQGKTPSLMQLLDIQGNKMRPLTYDDYLGIKEKVDDLLLFLIGIIEDGDFIITPNMYCKYCPYNTACRKQNKNTAVRNSISKTARKLKDYHAA